MERRVTGNCHARCGAGENQAITSNDYLSLFDITDLNQLPVKLTAIIKRFMR